MRTLKYAILGLLNRKPMSGYDLSKEFSSQIGNFWSANHSQIYPELKRLLDEKLVVYNIEISGDVLEKKVYTITEKGRKEFLKWLNKDEPIGPTPKDVFRLRMYFCNNLDVETRIRLLKNQLSQHEDKLAFLLNEMKRYNTVPPIDSDDFGDYLVLDSAIMREETTIRWLKKCISLCQDASDKK